MIISSRLYFSVFFISVLTLTCCHDKDNKTNKNTEKKYLGIYEDQIRRMEKLIPNALFDTNHVAIWRSGSIYYSEYLSVLIIEKKQLKDKQLLCYYMSFDSDKPSNYRNWKYCQIYEITLENSPFRFPLKDQIKIEDLDTLSYTHGEGIESNNYFVMDFKSDTIYPICKKYNSKYSNQIAQLFNQISKREKVQTLVLTKDSVDYQDAYRIIKGSDVDYIIKEDKEVNSLQRRYGDK
jgi:hypothetical protein